jgi:hypothetical protein
MHSRPSQAAAGSALADALRKSEEEKEREAQEAALRLQVHACRAGDSVCACICIYVFACPPMCISVYIYLCVEIVSARGDGPEKERQLLIPQEDSARRSLLAELCSLPKVCTRALRFR